MPHGKRQLGDGVLLGLFHHRWSAPALARLDELEGGGKFATLQNTLGVGRESLRRALDALIELGLVKRNEGYGHPMRPEYLLTAAGARAAPLCGRLVAAIERMHVEDVALKKWSMPVVYTVSRTGGRFSEILTSLEGATPRAVALALKELQRVELVRREVVLAYPPTTQYRLTRGGARLGPTLDELSRAA